uniref:Transposase n=1 Tax=Geladintestivirus 5 TaxID=3233137 RepID=A0AAU8MH34_9CAUD
MLHLYFFKSSEERDGLSCLTVMSSNIRRAYRLAVINFIKNGYKRYPVRLAI